MPPIVVTIIGALQMLVQLGNAAPGVIKAAKEMINALFGSKTITKDQQDSLYEFVNQLETQILAGEFPDWWNPRPDPTDVSST